jgi:DNA-binding NarL/FixJ family response regulator
VIREQFPETALLILSAHVEVERAMTLLASGRRTGYLLRSRVSDVDEYLDAVGRVSRGGSVVDPALVQELVAARDVEDPLEELTRRERDVLALMAEGRSDAGIGRRLWITEGTVEKHVHSILTKLQLAVIDESARTIRRDCRASPWRIRSRRRCSRGRCSLPSRWHEPRDARSSRRRSCVAPS